MGTVYNHVIPVANWLSEEGHDVAFACSDDGFTQLIRSAGYECYDIGIVRDISVKPDLLAFIELSEILAALSRILYILIYQGWNPGPDGGTCDKRSCHYTHDSWTCF